MSVYTLYLDGEKAMKSASLIYVQRFIDHWKAIPENRKRFKIEPYNRIMSMSDDDPKHLLVDFGDHSHFFKIVKDDGKEPIDLDEMRDAERALMRSAENEDDDDRPTSFAESLDILNEVVALGKVTR